MSRKPVIAITAQPRAIDSGAGGPMDAHTLGAPYVDALVRAGAVPVLLPIVDPSAVPAMLDIVDGVVLTGGGDLDPSHYGGRAHPEISHVRPERDAFDLAVAREAARRRLPTLGICRGHQVLNVALGGSLIEDIPSEVGHAVDHRAWGEAARKAEQPVRIDPSSRLAELLGVTDLLVNSVHHQAIRTPAPGLHPVAWAPDGVIEAVEPNDDDWPLISVQWHPEALADHDGMAQALFDAVVDAARRRTSIDA